MALGINLHDHLGSELLLFLLIGNATIDFSRRSKERCLVSTDELDDASHLLSYRV